MHFYEQGKIFNEKQAQNVFCLSRKDYKMLDWQRVFSEKFACEVNAWAMAITGTSNEVSNISENKIM